MSIDPSTTIPAATFKLSVPLIKDSMLQLPLSDATPLFVVGPNGVGKSGLMQILYRQNIDNCVRISAHRQSWMQSNYITFSPLDKTSHANNAKGQDNQADARYTEWNSSVRSGLIISDLIDADNALSRSVRELMASGDLAGAEKLVQTLPPLDVISELLESSGIPIKLSIAENSGIVASKNGSATYSIAALSDGERAALLMAGAVLTAKPGSLILIDEPERHLHASIVTPLLLQLFAKRFDCSFVISTHELSLPVSCRNCKTALVRDSQTLNDDIVKWDIDILQAEVEVDDLIKESILGSRRKLMFIEGEPDSLDKPIYELLFPDVAIHPRGSCGEVERAVLSIRDSEALAWVKAFGIVDQDQLASDKKQALEVAGVYPLTVYSVEGLYYNPTVVEAVAARQHTVNGNDPQAMVEVAWEGVLAAVEEHSPRLAARLTEQAVKDAVSLEMLDWKKIQSGQNADISVDAQALFQAELASLQSMISSQDIEGIIARYPVRETPALGAIVNALDFKSASLYEGAVRKLVSEDPEIKAHLLKFFGNLPAALT